MFKFEDFGIELDYIVLGALVATIILFVLCIILMAKQSKLNKRYRSFMSGENGKNLEDLILQRFKNVDDLNVAVDNINNHLKEIESNLLKTYQKVGIVKYDAFKEIGGNLSFVVTLLTKENNGFILNSMHSNREGCFTYVKEVVNGEVYVALSEEEKQALEDAKKNYGTNSFR